MTVIRDPMRIPSRSGTIYPRPFADGFDKRIKRALGNVAGLTQFGVNLTTLEPGAMSAQRHWHRSEDEFVFVLDGELVLVTDAGDDILSAGMAAGFAAGVANAHHLINRSALPATYLEIGTRASDDDVIYPDVDLALAKRNGVVTMTRKNGEPHE